MFRVGILVASLIATVYGHGTLTHPKPRGHFPNQIYENDPTITGPNIRPNGAFICRNRPAAAPVQTLTAGSNYDIRFDMSAPHVGDCALYISYDADLPAENMRFFKIKGWSNCVSLNRQFVPTMIPAWLPNTDHAVLRWEWVATHVYPGLELFNQCADVAITGGRPAGSPLPATYTIGNHIPSNGNAYCNPYNGIECTDADLVFPADAQDPGGSPAPNPTPSPPAPTPEPTAPTPNPTAPTPNPTVPNSEPTPNPTLPNPAPTPNPTAPTPSPPSPSPNPAPPPDSGGEQTCVAAPGKDVSNGVSDAACARCANGYKWWPCNQDGFCICTGDDTGDDTGDGGSGGGDSSTCGNQVWNKCGGRGFAGPTCCPAGSYCSRQSQWYSQCIPNGGRRTRLRQ